MFLSICLYTMGNRLVFTPMKTFINFQSCRPPTLSPFFSSPSILFFSLLSFFCHCFLPPLLCKSPFHPSSPPVPSSLSVPVNIVIAWGALQCITDLSPLVLFMALSLFKFNQASMEPPEPFQFTTWTPQDGKSNANKKV